MEMRMWRKVLQETKQTKTDGHTGIAFFYTRANFLERLVQKNPPEVP